MVRIYTKTGDDGTTGLLYGGRVPKDSLVMQINGAVDEAQASMGVARAEVDPGSELDALLVGLERDLYVLMAEVATDPSKRAKLVAGDDAGDPGDDRGSRDPYRCPDRAVRHAGRLRGSRCDPGVGRAGCGPDRRSPGRAPGGIHPAEGSLVGQYLNRLSDLLWAMARWAEGEEHLLARGTARRSRRAAKTPRTASGESNQKEQS